MKIRSLAVLMAAILFCAIVSSYADQQAETAGNGSATIDGRPVKDIQDVVKKYLDQHTGPIGAFEIYDSVTKQLRRVKLINLQDGISKAGNNYYCRAYFKDIDNNEFVDLDVNVRYMGGMPNVTDVQIYKVKDKERYTYDNNGNRVPVKP